MIAAAKKAKIAKYSKVYLMSVIEIAPSMHLQS
jgi:hypothetical protein